MRKTTLDALAKLNAWRKAYKKWRWIRNVWWSFTDAYCQENSPVDVDDKAEIDRLLAKIEAYDRKAYYEWEITEGEAYQISKRFHRNKTVMEKYNEIALIVARGEGLIR